MNSFITFSLSWSFVKILSIKTVICLFYLLELEDNEIATLSLLYLWPYNAPVTSHRAISEPGTEKAQADIPRMKVLLVLSVFIAQSLGKPRDRTLSDCQPPLPSECTEGDIR